MVTLTQAFSDAQNAQDRVYKEKAVVKLSDNTTITLTNEDFWSNGFKIEDAVSNHDSFDIGAVVMNQITLTINNIDGRFDDVDFLGANITAYVGIYGINDEIIYGKYDVMESPRYSDGIITLIGYDYVHKLAKVYDGSETFPESMRVLVRHSFNACEMSYEQSNINEYIPNTSVADFWTGRNSSMTYRQIIAWACQIAGCFARVNRSGKIMFGWYAQDNLSAAMANNENMSLVHTINQVFSPTIASNDTVITGVAVSETSQDQDGGEITVTSRVGSSGYIVAIEDNPLVQSNRAQSIATTLNNKLNGFTFRIASIACVPNVAIEAGDVAVYIDRHGNKYPIIVSSVTFTGQGNMRIESCAKEQDGTQLARFSSSSQSYAKLSDLIKQEIGERRSGDTTVLSNISATYATIESLNVTNGNIENLSGELASYKTIVADEFTADRGRIGTLETNTANIGTLSADLANVKTLLAGSAGVGNLQNIHLTSANAVIDEAVIKSLVANFIAAADLKAGTISTDKFRITSNDNTFDISGGTLQIKDGNNNVRIQMGKDGQGNFTFVIYDSTGQGTLIDSTGVKASAISNGLIVDRMVASAGNGYNGIDASKLDINSVVGALNDEGGIKSSAIHFDAENQSLQQLYTTLRRDVTNNADSITGLSGDIQDAKDTADQAKTAAANAMDAVNGINTLSGIVATLPSDTQIVHTLADGSGADYTNCKTQIKVYLGTSEVTSQCNFYPSAQSGMSVSWIRNTHTAQITDMTRDSGYVDITAVYHENQSDEVEITKRFTVAKIKDGSVGKSYTLTLDNKVFTTNVAKTTITPNVITGSASYTEGSSPHAYNGIYELYATTNNSTWTLIQKVTTSASTFSVSGDGFTNAIGIKVVLKSSDDTTVLGTEYATVMVDPEVLRSTVTDLDSRTTTTEQNVTNINSSITGINTRLTNLTTQISGISAGNLVYQTIYSENANNSDLIDIQAVVYKDGRVATTDFPSNAFTWAKKNGTSETSLGSGYTIQVDKATISYGITVIGRFDSDAQPSQPSQGESNDE